jgi:hypothetical protein
MGWGQGIEGKGSHGKIVKPKVNKRNKEPEKSGESDVNE